MIHFLFLEMDLIASFRIFVNEWEEVECLIRDVTHLQQDQKECASQSANKKQQSRSIIDASLLSLPVLTKVLKKANIHEISCRTSWFKEKSSYLRSCKSCNAVN